MKIVSTALKIAVAVVFVSLASGCAVETLKPGAKDVSIISEQQAKACRLLDSFTTNNQNTLSENPQQDARNRAFNRVAELGGNSLRIVSTNTQLSRSGVGSIFVLNGEAYACK